MTENNPITEALSKAKPVDDAPFELYGPRLAANDSGAGDDRGDHDDSDGAPDRLTDDELANLRGCAALDQNDRDNGRRLIIWYGLDIAYVPGMGWITFKGSHWERDEGDLGVRLLAQDLVDWIKREVWFLEASPGQKRLIAAADKLSQKPAADWTDADHHLVKKADTARTALSKKRTQRRTFAVSSGNAGKTEAMLKQAASRKAIPPDELDADPMLFNVANGTLRFGRCEDPESEPDDPRLVGTCERIAHDRAHMGTKRADVDHDPEAKCPGFEAFLARVQPDADFREFLQVSHGYALLLGGNDAQKLFFHYGGGANGKSVFIETLGRLADMYRAVVDPATITGDNQRDGSKANSDIARLHSARLVTIEELPRDTPLKENLIKALTGGTRMVARFLQKEIFEFDPEFVAIMSGNDMPTVSGTDHGIWRRLLIIEWAVTIPPHEQRPFGEMLKLFDAERAGILNWLIEGAIKYLTSGLTPYIPAKVLAFTDDYREERDPVGSFAAACLERRENAQVNAGDMYEHYKRWSEANAIRPYQQTAFGRRMNALGFKKKRGSHVVYLDVRLGDVPSIHDPRPSGEGML